MWSFNFLNFKNNFSQACINSAISLSNHSCIILLILIFLLGAISLTTFINLIRKSLYATSIQEKNSEFEKLIFCNSSRNTMTVLCLRDLRKTLLCLLNLAFFTFCVQKISSIHHCATSISITSENIIPWKLNFSMV